jgi:hypothetical protein
LGFWNKLTGKNSNSQNFDEVSDDDLISLLVDEHFEAVSSNQEPDFHGEVLLNSALVLPAIQGTVPIKSWFFKISSIPVPITGRPQALIEAIETIDRQLYEKGVLPEKAYRNIALLRGGMLEKRRIVNNAADDIHLFGRAEKRQYATPLNLRDAISASPVFAVLDSELQRDEETGDYNGERFDAFCSHLNEDFYLWVNINISDMPAELRKISWLEFFLCYEENLSLNNAFLVGPGWDVSLLGLPECCKEKFDGYLNALHLALGGEVLQLPK